MKRILIVEDDATIKKSLAYLFKLENFSVETADHGKKAIEILDSGFQPDVIILDYRMPEMDGEEFISVTRKMGTYSQIPIIVLSGDGQIEEKTKELKVHATVRKPVDVDQLVQLARSCCSA